jgi:hypothetical protein
MSDGETIEEAIANPEDAKRCWIAAMKETGGSIPPPSVEPAEGYTAGSGSSARRNRCIVASPSAPNAKGCASTHSLSRCWHKVLASALLMATEGAK